MSQINEIIFSKNITEGNTNCFVFVVKSQDISTNIKKKNVPEHINFLNTVNPSKILYGICFKVRDVMENVKLYVL